IIISVLLLVGSLNLSDIVRHQDGPFWKWHAFLIFDPSMWPAGIIVGAVMFAMLVLFFVSALAETNRPPFDLPEAESELVAGYQVEYSSTPYLLFMIGEYLNIVMMCAMVNILFLGGWNSPRGSGGRTFTWPVIGPFLGWLMGASWLGFFIFYAKIWFQFFMFAMVKAIVPRYRYDQLMRIGWKLFLPTSLVAVAVIAAYITFWAPASALT